MSKHNRPTLKYDISKMAIGSGRLYFSRLAYNPVPGLRKSGIPAAEKDRSLLLSESHHLLVHVCGHLHNDRVLVGASVPGDSVLSHRLYHRLQWFSPWLGFCFSLQLFRGYGNQSVVTLQRIHTCTMCQCLVLNSWYVNLADTQPLCFRWLIFFLGKYSWLHKLTCHW